MIIRFIPVIINNNISLAYRLLNLKQPYMLILCTPPCKLRPEADSHISRNHVSYSRWIITFKNNFRRKSRMLAETVTDIAELP